MKNTNRYLVFLLLVPLLSGCNATKQISIHTMEPSPVAFSDDIKKIGIIDTSVPTEGTAVRTRLDQIIASEERWLTEKGTDAAITGLFDELLKDKRFEVIKLLDSVPRAVEDFGTDLGTVPWNEVEALCAKHGVDALFSLAFYETDTKVSIKKSSMMQPNLMRVKVKVPAKQITLETLIENGWRIYDPKNRRLIDEIVFNDQIIATGKGTDPIAAYQAIGDRKTSILEQSRSTGTNYGLRMMPSEGHILRDYYVRGTNSFVEADERIQQGDLEGALALWAMEASHPTPKIRSRACHNLAVLHEYQGNLELAMDWASRSFDIDRSKNNQEYLDALKWRMAQKRLVARQLAQNEFSK
ncbi:hypothetical protein FK220_011795 [Flavobacteriaceae bacterium TP-CH-4]|uniref:Tetratricopeptide repeat protein n=1 Tax=Pelagihabitans pacificus TaxID=2696054 RepID=A0A967ATD1_9FLAO|nr:DUF6340 family protein [Pelagihabitans pacificus]NHF60029.1 hypothetical protein [Pelagihabitans pacificus]